MYQNCLLKWLFYHNSNFMFLGMQIISYHVFTNKQDTSQSVNFLHIIFQDLHVEPSNEGTNTRLLEGLPLVTAEGGIAVSKVYQWHLQVLKENIELNTSKAKL